MSPISPHLDQLLNQWTARGSTLRKDIEFQKELLATSLMALTGTHIGLCENRRNQRAQAEHEINAALERWEERLRRIGEWKNQTHQLQQSVAAWRGGVRTVHWFLKAEALGESFARHLRQQAALLLEEHQLLRQDLDSWQESLVAQRQILEQLKSKEKNFVNGLLVSRTRKQLEVDFLMEQKERETVFSKRILKLRKSLNHNLGRVHRAQQAMDQQTSHPQVTVELQKKELEAMLKPLGGLLLERREQILSDALLFEACRSTLRWLQETVQRLRCIEDAYRPHPSLWKKWLFNSAT